MKKIYTFIIVLVLAQQPVFSQYGQFTFDFGLTFDFSNTDFSNTNITINLGNNFNSGNFDFGNFDVFNINLNNCCEDGNYKFGGTNFTELNAGFQYEAAKKAALLNWYDAQRILIKTEIDKYFNKTFANYKEAVNAAFIHFGKSNHKNFDYNLRNLKNKQIAISDDYETQNKIKLIDLKLLQLRRQEINAGNINNSEYPYREVNGIPLKDYRTINSINVNWNAIKTNLIPYLAIQQNSNYFSTALNNLDSSFDTYLLNLQRTFYDDHLNPGQRLFLEQFCINILMAYRINPNAFLSPLETINYDIPDGLEIGPVFMPTGTEEILENYLNMYAETSVFKNMNAHSIAQEILDAQGAATYREAYDLALSVLNSQQFELNRLVNEVEIEDTYICECNCNSTEIEFTNDLDNNMEPKWGQLANKQEILDEINKVNLDNLTFEQQIMTLANHFEKHLKYDINSSDMPYIINPSTDVNRYVYSEVGGWIDFHHVFKIFEWATQNGPFSAITQGELGEMWQSLKNNNSAYSYEDLPSNLLGVGMYIRFSQDLALGNITWYQAIKTALDEISCIEPESAPNFDYIPYIINEYYPKNYTYTPLLGEQLKQYHKQKFCERPLYEQQRTKQVHELFPR